MQNPQPLDLNELKKESERIKQMLANIILLNQSKNQNQIEQYQDNYQTLNQANLDNKTIDSKETYFAEQIIEITQGNLRQIYNILTKLHREFFKLQRKYLEEQFNVEQSINEQEILLQQSVNKPSEYYQFQSSIIDDYIKNDYEKITKTQIFQLNVSPQVKSKSESLVEGIKNISFVMPDIKLNENVRERFIKFASSIKLKQNSSNLLYPLFVKVDSIQRNILKLDTLNQQGNRQELVREMQNYFLGVKSQQLDDFQAVVQCLRFSKLYFQVYKQFIQQLFTYDQQYNQGNQGNQ